MNSKPCSLDYSRNIWIQQPGNKNHEIKLFHTGFLWSLICKKDTVIQYTPEGEWEHPIWETHAILLAPVLFILKTNRSWPCSKASNPMIHWGFILWGSVLSSNGKQAVPIKTCLKERKSHIFLLIDRRLINFEVKKFLYSSGMAEISNKHDVWDGKGRPVL